MLDAKQVDSLQAGLRREIARLEAGSWIGHPEQKDERITQVGKLLDKAISECDTMDSLLRLYSVELSVSMTLSPFLLQYLTYFADFERRHRVHRGTIARFTSANSKPETSTDGIAKDGQHNNDRTQTTRTSRKIFIAGLTRSRRDRGCAPDVVPSLAHNRSFHCSW